MSPNDLHDFLAVLALIAAAALPGARLVRLHRPAVILGLAITALTCAHAATRTVRLPIQLPFPKAMELLLTGDLITAQEALRAPQLNWSDMDRVLLVGGATRMPAVVEMLTGLTGKEPDRSIAPDEAVAHGAALYAGMLLARMRGEPTPFSIINVNSHSLGIVANDPRTKQKRNVILIRRNTPLPAVHRRVFHTHKDGQRSLLLQIVEGESKVPEEPVNGNFLEARWSRERHLVKHWPGNCTKNSESTRRSARRSWR